MSGWNDDDEVTTTYGSIQLSLSQAHAAGVKTERERIIKLLEEAQITKVEIMDDNFEPREIKVRCQSVRADFLITLIKGDDNA